MQYSRLGNSKLTVSKICLGTMTYGEQNTESEGHQQLDYAVSEGVNFIDTAELYAIPPKAETYGATEKVIGSWLKKRGQRDDIVLATKIAGPGPDWVSHIRGGRTRFSQSQINEALDNSLQRLQTDYVDLYQLHWPERDTNYFGQLGYKASDTEVALTPIHETLAALTQQVEAGKVRYIGLSNETPWGIMQFLAAAKLYSLPTVVSVQNPYSLLNRTYEVGCAEISHRENIGLLAYSPLGFGVLTGKYLENTVPADARLSLWPHYARYSNEQAVIATQAYVSLARQHGLDPAQMALAYVNSRPFVAANIIGATSMTQLKNNIDSINLTLSQELLAAIEDVHQSQPNPAP
jgi:aryl-alcohol dehydrogenase-like predicted oxidoreductase